MDLLDINDTTGSLFDNIIHFESESYISSFCVNIYIMYTKDTNYDQLWKILDADKCLLKRLKIPIWHMII